MEENEMNNDAAHKKGWQIFEVVVGLPFLAAIALQRILPIALPHGLLTYVTITAGVILALAGVIFVVLARQEFARYGQPTDPGHTTSRILTTGVFSFSRNPLYLGGILFLAGISLAFRLTWGLILLVPSVIACHYILIVPEEKYLAEKFDEQYREYKATVRRWVGRTVGSREQDQ
jgi:protein-S-isoprenylcysteine O-methyltransferase Ste14